MISQKGSIRLRFFHDVIRKPWWPLISVLGIYSSGKSAFINHSLQHDLPTEDPRFTAGVGQDFPGLKKPGFCRGLIYQAHCTRIR